MAAEADPELVLSWTRVVMIIPFALMFLNPITITLAMFMSVGFAFVSFIPKLIFSVLLEVRVQPFWPCWNEMLPPTQTNHHIPSHHHTRTNIREQEQEQEQGQGEDGYGERLYTYT